MQQLHLVGFTTDQEGLIFSARKGSKSGSYVVRLDKRLLAKIEEAQQRQEEEDEARGRVRVERVESILSPREIQARLRSGRTIAQVAREAGVEEEWVARFAPPIQAEQAQVIGRARALTFAKQRLGESAHPLGESVLWNTAEKGVRLPDDVFNDCWSAFHLREGEWVVRFAYFNRKKVQHAEWEVDLREGTLTARNRLASELGYVEPGRRRKRLPPAQPPPVAAKPQPERRRPARPASRLATPKKTATKKTATKKTAAKKTAAKKTGTKKAVARKMTAKESAARKPSTRKAVATRTAAAKRTARTSPAAGKTTPSGKRSTATKASAKKASANRPATRATPRQAVATSPTRRPQTTTAAPRAVEARPVRPPTMAGMPAARPAPRTDDLRRPEPVVSTEQDRRPVPQPAPVAPRPRPVPAAVPPGPEVRRSDPDGDRRAARPAESAPPEPASVPPEPDDEAPIRIVSNTPRRDGDAPPLTIKAERADEARAPSRGLIRLPGPSRPAGERRRRPLRAR